MRQALYSLTGTLGIGLAAIALPGLSQAEDELQAWQRAQAVGEAESCIPLRQIRETHVHDDRTIDFELTGGRTYRNTLPVRCPGLGFEESFSYETGLGQLCSSDIIAVLRQPIDIPGPRCGLGEFVPIEIPSD